MCPQASRKCLVCNEAPSKYKCPSCLVPYCSLVCCKRHKETPCARPVVAEEKPAAPVAAPAPELAAEKPTKVEEPDEVLSNKQLEAIASSSEIREALMDESLQKLIQSIDNSPDAMNELEKAMGVEGFRIFTDKVLSYISP